MLFGRSLFAGALAAGYITVAGTAACTATAAAEAQVNYFGQGDAQAHATVAADALRSAVAQGIPAQGYAQVSAAPVAYFAASGVAQSVALASGAGWSQLNGYGEAQVAAIAEGSLYRRVRMPQQPVAVATATIDGALISQVTMYGRPALARARLIGTTWHVGYGTASATAALQGEGQKRIGARQVALAEAHAAGRMLYTAGMAGRAMATAVLQGDAAVTKNGIRHFELFGDARVNATAWLSYIEIYQPQIMRAFALAYGEAQQIRGFAGRAAAVAKATGYMDMKYTGEVGSPAGGTASAIGAGVRHVSLNGSAYATASASGEVRAEYWAAGTAALTAQVQATALHYLMADQPAAQASAHALAAAVRVCLGQGVPATAGCVARGYNQINDLVRAPASRTVAVAGNARTVAVAQQPRLMRAA